MSTDVPSSLDLQQLPDDPALLKQIIAEREQAYRAELQQVVESAVAVAVKSAVKAAVEATTAATQAFLRTQERNVRSTTTAPLRRAD